MAAKRPLWRCEVCGRSFANRKQSHACGRADLERHFAGKPPEIRAIFDAFVARVEAVGPVKVLPQKTRIAFQTRMSFAQLTPRRGWVDGHLVLAERHEHPLFRRITTYSPRNHVHEFRLTSPRDAGGALLPFLRKAYAVGGQKHLEQPLRPGLG